MRHSTLLALTWGTVAAAVGSALWLAASEPSWSEGRKLKPGAPPSLRLQPTANTATGTSRSGTEASPGESQRMGEPLSR
jgi:hypothetical protein